MCFGPREVLNYFASDLCFKRNYHRLKSRFQGMHITEQGMGMTEINYDQITHSMYERNVNASKISSVFNSI